MKKGDAPVVVVDHVFVAGVGSFYAYCAIVVYKNPSLAGRVQKELWDYFQTSSEMSTWDPDLGSGSVSDNVALTDILCTLATRVYPLNARLYNNRFENGHRDYNAPLENVGKRHAPLFMSLHLASDGELTMHVLRNQKTGESRVPTRVINVLTRTQEKEDDAAAAALGNNSNRPDESSQYSLAVFDNKTRAHMQIAARFRLSPNKTVHYMEFDLGLSRLEPAWNIILKGCKDIPVFIFAMQTRHGVRYAKYIAHWPVDFVEPFVTLSPNDDGLIVVPVISNVLSDAKKCVVAEMRCVVEN